MKKINDFTVAARITNEISNRFMRAICGKESLRKLILETNLTVDNLAEFVYASKLGLASSKIYTPKKYKKQFSNPDAFDENDAACELKSVKEMIQFLPGRARRGEYKKFIGKIPVIENGFLKCKLNFNGANRKEKIDAYKGWRSFIIFQNAYEIMAIAEVPDTIVVDQLHRVLETKEKIRLSGRIIHDNFNDVFYTAKIDELLYLNKEIYDKKC